MGYRKKWDFWPFFRYKTVKNGQKWPFFGILVIKMGDMSVERGQKGQKEENGQKPRKRPKSQARGFLRKSLKGPKCAFAL